MWGAQFAYQVGLLIVAHISKQPLPFKNSMTVLSMIGALDAVNSNRLSAWAFQTTDDRRIFAIYIAFALAVANYAFFIYDVVGTVRFFNLKRLKMTDDRYANISTLIA